MNGKVKEEGREGQKASKAEKEWSHRDVFARARVPSFIAGERSSSPL